MSPVSIELADLSWPQAERYLNDDSVVMIPLGAAAKEHGPHLRLDNDFQLAERLKCLVMARCVVVVAPTVSYHHYPAFSEYPGSTSLSFGTARDLIIDIVRSLAAFGPRRFYVLNTGVSTNEPLQEAAGILRESGILLRHTDIEDIAADAERELLQQQRGGHADEAETSMMLCLAPQRVDMGQACRDDRPRNGPGGLSRTPGQPGIYSPSGIWGDATLATAAKGRALVEATVGGIVNEIEALRGEIV